MTVQFDKGFLTSLYLILPALHRDSSPSVRIRHDIAVIHLPISAMPRKVFLFFYFCKNMFIVLTWKIKF